jgi:methylmalonyl-CoA/ethylmalonyl-CoA epimerase
MKLKLHHIGLVVPKILDFAEVLRALGMNKMTEPEPDPIQNVTAIFVTAGEEQGAYIELLEPGDDSSPITNFLKERGCGLHHLCFEVDDIERIGDELVRKGFRMVCPPVECVGYDKSFGRQCTHASKISFFLLPSKILIELLQKGT